MNLPAEAQIDTETNTQTQFNQCYFRGKSSLRRASLRASKSDNSGSANAARRLERDAGRRSVVSGCENLVCKRE